MEAKEGVSVKGVPLVGEPQEVIGDPERKVLVSIVSMCVCVCVFPFRNPKVSEGR